MIKIHYITDTRAKHLVEKLLSFNLKGNFELLPFDQGSFEPVDYLMIVEPYDIGGVYFDVHPIWQKYLKDTPNMPRRFDSTKLLVANFEEHQSPNSINLLNLEESLEKVLTKPLLSPTELAIPLSNESIEDMLKLFFKDHGEFSLLKRMQTLKMAVENMRDAIHGKIMRNFSETIEFLFENAQNDWHAFESRWNWYFKYFDKCPFFGEKEIVSRNLEQTAPFFKAEQPTEELFKKWKVFDNIIEIDCQLEIMLKYVQEPKISTQNITA